LMVGAHATFNLADTNMRDINLNMRPFPSPRRNKTAAKKAN